MNNDDKRFAPVSNPEDIEVENMLRNYYQKEISVYPDFAKMAERAMAEGDTLKTESTIKAKAWYLTARKTILTAAVLVLILGLLKFSFYAMPRWEAFAYAAVRSVPFAEHLISKQDVGLLREAKKGNIQAQELSATVDGFRIDIVGTYADSNRTVIFFQLNPPPADSGSWMPESIKLVDQFGMSRYNSYSVSMDSDTNKGMIEFPAAPAWQRVLGVRFHLEIAALNWTTTDFSKDKIGPWTMEWVQEWQDAKETIHPAAVVTNEEVEIKLKKVTLTPSSTKLDYTAELKKSVAHENLVMYIEKASDGTRYEFLSAGFRTSGFSKAGTGDILFPPLEGAGGYRFVIKRTDGIAGKWVLPFTIPK
ncbi:DUF4179 domain-containing protein [Bacillus sp. FJAT-29953]|nr:DUF4179 domain-containing protein [Bacillus sp. FJAT-29953]